VDAFLGGLIESRYMDAAWKDDARTFLASDPVKSWVKQPWPKGRTDLKKVLHQ